jgi:hypothetical protein
MKRKIINIIGCLVVFSIGITIGKLFNWGYFELSKEVNIIDALTLFVTIGVAIYVAKILEKEVQDVRIEKELYIAKITEIESILKDFEILVEEKDSSYNKINNRINSCRMKKGSIFNTIKENLKQIKTKDFDSFEKEITDGINSLKRLLTETPAVKETNPAISVKKDIVTYSPNRIIEINTEINSISENLFKIKVRINNL